MSDGYVGMCTASQIGLVTPTGEVVQLAPGLELITDPTNMPFDDSPDEERMHVLWVRGSGEKSWVATDGFRFF